MKRTSINPMKWGEPFFLDQGEVVEGATRVLRCSGQTALTDDPNAEMGLSVVSPNDTRAQMEYALQACDDILTRAGMTRSNIVHLRFFTTDIAGFLDNYEVYANWIAPSGIKPPQSLIGVAALVMPELRVEIEMEAVA